MAAAPAVLCASASLRILKLGAHVLHVCKSLLQQRCCKCLPMLPTGGAGSVNSVNSAQVMRPTGAPSCMRCAAD